MHPRWLRCSSFKYGPDILSRQALPSGRLVGLGALRVFHHGLLRRGLQPVAQSRRMHRRTLLQWLVSGAAAWPLRGVHLHAQAAALSSASVATLRALAPVVLPSELGGAGHDKVVGDFVQWLASYRSGAERSWGYGRPRKTTTPVIESTAYETQLQALNERARRAAASSEQGSFAALSIEARRAVISELLETNKVRSLPGAPNGTHIVLDFMSFYYSSGPATDLMYRARIAPATCRGLAGAHRNPAS